MAARAVGRSAATPRLTHATIAAVPTVPFLGEAACLAAAVLWAVAVELFRAPIGTWGPTTVNLAKCVLGTALLAVTVAVVGGFGDLLAAPAGALAVLALSGLVGLTVGDTALFVAVTRIGVHRTLLLQTLAPVFAAGIAAATTGEWPTGGQLLGGLLILAGVALVIGPPRAGEGAAPNRAATSVGLAMGLLAALGQGAGVVLSRVGMASIDVAPATLVRLATAAASLVLLAACRRQLGTLLHLAGDPTARRRVVPATVLGTYLAMLLMMLGVALTPAAVAAVLLGTTPVFSLLLVAALHRRMPSSLEIAGTLVAVAGVALLARGG
jgi:drug/metabolite transporter (DMT)-like permease